MKFTPKTDEELKAESKYKLLAEGKGNFEIVKATEKLSKAGNPMVELVLRVWDKNGDDTQFFDYLTSEASWKIKQMLESIGKPDIYTTGQFDEYCLVGGTGELEIKIQKSAGYEDKNAVKAYLPASAKKKEFDKKLENVGNGLPDFNPDDDLQF